jgi:hypothetical protein
VAVAISAAEKNISLKTIANLPCEEQAIQRLELTGRREQKNG